MHKHRIARMETQAQCFGRWKGIGQVLTPRISNADVTVLRKPNSKVEMQQNHRIPAVPKWNKCIHAKSLVLGPSQSQSPTNSHIWEKRLCLSAGIKRFLSVSNTHTRERKWIHRHLEAAPNKQQSSHPTTKHTPKKSSTTGPESPGAFYPMPLNSIIKTQIVQHQLGAIR